MAKENVHEGHRMRVKEQFLKEGMPLSMPDHKVLEMLLFYAIPRMDTNEIAHNLIKTFGSFAGVLNADYSQLIKVNGISKNSAILIKMLVPMFRRYETEQNNFCDIIHSLPEAAKYFLNLFKGEPKEKVIVMCLDNKNKIIVCEEMFSGSVNTVDINTRLIAETAMKHNASGIILSHNHPNGLPEPSINDRRTTIQLSQALKYLKISLYDHIIVANDKYFSMASSPDFTEVFGKLL